MQAATHDVAVIGLGPVGATLAGLLARYGFSVAVYEKSRAIYAQPRAVGFDHDAMRIFQRIGIADRLAPHIAPFRDGEYFGVGGRLIQRVRHVPPPYPLTWSPNYTCDQPGLESVLREALADYPNVEVDLGCELLACAEDGDGVALSLRDDAGRTIQRRARYVVGCDGASSPLRRALGIELESLDYDEPWIVVDVRVAPEHLGKLPATNVQYCQPERPSTFITCPGNHRRWEFMLLPGEPVEGAVSEQRLWQLLSRWLKPGEASIWRAAAYRFHALIARDWRRGRILLAGDAAHQTPPFLGQGMCQGLRDAGNLAWKLDCVLRGEAGEGLLDTYAQERRPHVVETTRIAKEFGRIISERDPDRARERDLRMLGGEAGEARTLYRQELIPGLTSGLVSSTAPLAGKVFPQPLVTRGADADVLLDDVSGPCWRVVVAGGSGVAVKREIVAASNQQGLPAIALGVDADDFPRDAVQVTEHDDLLGRWLAAAGCVGALVRPDHYVFGAFGSAQEAAQVLEEFAAFRIAP